MKKMILCITTILTMSALFAQPPGHMKPPPPEKRWERESGIINDKMKLSSGQLHKLKTVFLDFYKSMDALHEQNKEQRPSKTLLDKLHEKRNTEVKKILSASEYAAYLNVEPNLGPPKRKPGEQQPPL